MTNFVIHYRYRAEMGMRREMRTPRYATKWLDIPKVRC
ncbi:hypothetical protein C1O24_20240 [Vibrio diazotrophicus]|nr:hypothetical protein C1O24_20240 [Vibrio diazotrophicus]